VKIRWPIFICGGFEVFAPYAYGVLLFLTAKKVGKKAATAWGF
jgi:hypothetical protein